MQTKTLPPPPARSHQKSNNLTFPKAESARESSLRTVAVLTARHSTLRERQTGFASLLDCPTPASLITHSFIDKLLVETARLAAEILELAERADDRSSKSDDDALGTRGMRMLADTSFDTILSIDAARHELDVSMDAEASRLGRHRQQVLRGAQRALTELEQQLAQTLSN